VGGDDIDDLWSAVNELRSSVSELTALVREVRAMLSERCDVRAKRQEDFEARLRVIEHRVWWASGAAAVVGVVAGWLARHV
jgi:ElaB/YqjD/DUF883 family membrane-anchored ribosome-binding protein